MRVLKTTVTTDGSGNAAKVSGQGQRRLITNGQIQFVMALSRSLSLAGQHQRFSTFTSTGAPEIYRIIYF